MNKPHSPPMRIAVVGHTNTGKTSLLRTLTRDSEFGEVSSRPSTTRHVEGVALFAHGEAIIELYDTPGMEDPIGLLEALEQIEQVGADRLDGPARIDLFLQSPQASGRFEQESKVLHQLRQSDAGFYVIDVRDPVLAKHRDELTILGSCAVPLLPILNFVHVADSHEANWREALGRIGLHAVIRFDTVAPERDGEQQLYSALATLVYRYREPLEQLIHFREEEAGQRHQSGLSLIAALLIDVAACHHSIDNKDKPALQQAVHELNDRVRQREQYCVDQLLALYNFRHDDIDAHLLPLLKGRWENDLFHPQTLQLMGVRIGGGAATGAAAGAGFDILTGGMSLGAATAIGAVIGGGLQTVRYTRRQLFDRLSGKATLSVDDEILRMLALRQLHLLNALEARGHAALTPIEQFATEQTGLRSGALPKALNRARAHPEWSSLYDDSEISPLYESTVHELTNHLSEIS